MAATLSLHHYREHREGGVAACSGERTLSKLHSASGSRKMNAPERRGQLIRMLEDALTIAEDLGDGTTEYLIERALDEARAQQFRPQAGGSTT